jgi:hypothetical protein
MFEEEIAEHSVGILVWYLMTNHAHLVPVPQREASLAGAFGAAHPCYTPMANFAGGGRVTCFKGDSAPAFSTRVTWWLQRGMLSSMPCEPDLLPSHGSIPGRLPGFTWELPNMIPLVTDRTLQGLVTDWEGFLRAAEDGPAKKLRHATRTGRPRGTGTLQSLSI